MAGIYIHIPFCKKACNYCNFHFSTNLSSKNEFITALLHEVELQKSYLNLQTIETIYFGGGTPSVLEQSELEIILSKIKEHFVLDKEIEITLEANPDDMTGEKLRSWKAVGINRLSIGIQSFFEEDLIFMNRSHNASQAKDCIELAKSCGFDNFSIDLIFGFPQLTDEKWKQNLQIAFDYNIAHLSCYAMTVEPKTALEHQIKKQKTKPINMEQSAAQFEYLMQAMKMNEYEHYEISNYAKLGFRAKHNSNYWKGIHYVGLGPSAHSFNGETRQWNVANNALYIKSLQQNLVPFELEILSKKEQLNEQIMISLRVIEGLNIDLILVNMNNLGKKEWSLMIAKFISEGLLIQTETQIFLTNNGKMIADYIAGNLFLEEAWLLP